MTKENESYRKQLYWVLAVMVGLILVLVLTPIISKSINSFEYEGLKFTKERFGKNITVYHYYYFFYDKAGDIVKYNLYLRNDPRENNIPVEGEVSLLSGKEVFLSINSTGLLQCEDSSIAVATLSSFLKDNGFNVTAGSPILEEAQNMTNSPGRIDCDTRPRNNVIKIQAGEETQITQDKLCYIIEVNNCEVLKAVEKFELKTILDAKN